VTLPLRFGHNEVAAEVTDREALATIARLLIARRDLRIELTGSAGPGEDVLPPQRLGERRARAAMWLLSALGPSRSRFVMRGGGREPGVRMTLVR
jgi:outer membrane protein OmpA-like peptidoglycan-associated protein